MSLQQNTIGPQTNQSIIDSPALLNTFLEGLGIESDQIDTQPFMDLLHSDLSHKIQEILQQAKKIMRHSKRDYLTCQDVKFAMQKLNMDGVFGYPSFAQPYSYQKTNISFTQENGEDVQASETAAQTSIWYTKPQQIDLKDMIVNHKIQQKQIPLEMTYSMHFTAINGVQPNVSENIEEAHKVVAEEQKDEKEDIKRVEIANKEILTTVSPQNADVEETKKHEIRKRYLGVQMTQASQQILNPTLLTKELDAFYHIFIDRFQKIEKELKDNQISHGNIIEFLKSSKPDKSSKLTPLQKSHEQFSKILLQLRTQPALKDLFVHIIHFIQSKNLLLVQNRPECDAQSFCLLLEAMESVVGNQFYDIEIRISDIMSVLMSISLQNHYHGDTNEASILCLKRKNAVIMGNLLNSNRTDMKHDFANILLKNIFESVNASNQKYKVFGCLTSLAQFGPVMAQKAILPNFDSIIESLYKIDQMDNVQNQFQEKSIMLHYKQILRTILENLMSFIRINKRAEDGKIQIQQISEMIKKHLETANENQDEDVLRKRQFHETNIKMELQNEQKTIKKFEGFNKFAKMN